jgi:hypothetical protein
MARTLPDASEFFGLKIFEQAYSETVECEI